MWCATTVVLPLCLIEFNELAPWLARKVVTFGAWLVVDSNLRERYQEEWWEGVEAWPGKLVKLIRATLLVGLAVPRINWDIFDAWWQREIGARVAIGALSRSCYSYFVYAPMTVPFLRGDARSGYAEYNRLLAMICKAIRTADTADRIEAMEILEALAQYPPSWIAPLHCNRVINDKVLKDLRDALQLRGYVSPSNDGRGVGAPYTA